MLDPDEEHAVAAQFGVARDQVRRDHLISHILAVLSHHFADEVLFFGGTALSRTFIPEGRLSEDIDLIALTHRGATAEKIEGSLIRGVRREYPGLTWHPPLTAVRDVEPAVLVDPNGATVRLQLLNRPATRPGPPKGDSWSSATQMRHPRLCVFPPSNRSQRGRQPRGSTAVPHATSTISGCFPRSARSTPPLRNSSERTVRPTNRQQPSNSAHIPTKLSGKAS
ncbi:nucleotidyl transferase AbiEii/AbiGii toxin family protein [Saccharopolyspora endophytica]|uniref:Nucleotidyl transferase AbiEii/AbiGii toxin family protein n=1 Tax=Saccharopolyspora endophytica TaxID=543886 RepID=A0ABS5DR65_9PSEU|nr:nucleotidyl transferase AbiEii/AbiGii toxin family protein [Saccharopolyspora endophytica]MBQ0928810.1 nucleotidyl transferase AbiEii/AbiGii toxin family protein [Saccharopolyspora endophytica]